jgi:hypothetical protein
MGLGDADTDNVGAVSLADARGQALAARARLLEGKDPLDERAAGVQVKAVEKIKAEGKTFE